MNNLDPNPRASRQDDGSPNPVDVLLRSFFRSEMPQPWPTISELKIEDPGLASGACQRRGMESHTGVMTHPARRSLIFHPRSSILYPRSSTRSRLVLAASVALLLIGSWWMGQRFSLTQSSSPALAGKLIGFKNQPGKDKSPRHQPTLPIR
jgi:hypothetical protein